MNYDRVLETASRPHSTLHRELLYSADILEYLDEFKKKDGAFLNNVMSNVFNAIET